MTNPYAAPEVVESTVAEPGDGPASSWETSLLVLATFPFWYIAEVYLFAFRAAWFLGHWPSYNNPDPKDLPPSFWDRNDFSGMLLAVVFWLGAAWLLRKLVRRWIGPRWRLAAAVVLIWLLWANAVVFLRMDPWGVMNWIAD